MARVVVRDVIGKVSSLMNEHKSDTIPMLNNIGVGGTLSLDDYIKSVLREALLLVFGIAPVDLLPLSVYYETSENAIIGLTESNKSEVSPKYYKNDVNGIRSLGIELPDSFVSLVRVKLKSWVKSVSFINSPESSSFAEQYNKHTTATNSRPKCNLVYSPRGRKSIECFPLDESGSAFSFPSIVPISPIEYLVLVETPKALSGSGMSENDLLFKDMSDTLFEAWCYMTASLVYNVYQDSNSSKAMERVAVSLLTANVVTAPPVQQ